MRTKIVVACKNKLAAEESLLLDLHSLDFSSFKLRLRDDQDALFTWGDNFLDPKYEVVISEPRVVKIDNMWRVLFSSDIFDWVECNREEISKGLEISLQQKIGDSLDRSKILNLSIPASKDEREKWISVVNSYKQSALEIAMTNALNDLDQLVGYALGLNKDDIAEIQRDLAQDAFLVGLRPRYPGTVTRKQGFRSGLDSEVRYE